MALKRRRISSGDGRGLQNRLRVRESVPGWVRLPHASAKTASRANRLFMQSWIALNMTPEIGPRMAAVLLERFGSPEAVFGARRTELEALKLKPAAIESILKREFFDKAEAEVKAVKELGGEILTLDDGGYPALLREIPDAPIVLYALGNWQQCLESPCVAVIGSRNCSTYGRNAAEMLARELARRGITIVSGLARGIDTAAHRGALDGNGKTAGVLGTGLDIIYPKENRRLIDEIIAGGGAVVTQFPLGTPPVGENFPYRNRIISGLSLGVLLVEASERSGSLITARLAMEQNRDVLAVPGNITSANSYGTNYLIKAGAKLVQQWQDVVSELPAEISAAILPPGPEVSVKPKANGFQPTLTPAGLDENEIKVWQLLRPDDSLHIDELLEASGMSFSELNNALVSLDIKDLIRVLPGRYYARKI